MQTYRPSDRDIEEADRRQAKNPRAKLTARQVLEICEQLDKGVDGVKLAKRYETTQTNIAAINVGTNWNRITRRRGRVQSAKKLTATQRQEIRQQFGTGVPAGRIAEAFGISLQHVYTVARAGDVPPPVPEGRERRRYAMVPRDRVKRIAEAVRAGESPQSIATREQLPVHQVTNIAAGRTHRAVTGFSYTPRAGGKGWRRGIPGRNF